MMNNSETQPTYSKVPYEKMVAQMKASKGNMGDASPALPAFMRGHLNTGENPLPILKSLPKPNRAEVSMPSSVMRKAEDSSS